MRWFSVDKVTGLVRVVSSMDRESSYVRGNRYTVLVLAYDNGKLTFISLSLLIFILSSSNSCFSLLLPALNTTQTQCQPPELEPWLLVYQM